MFKWLFYVFISLFLYPIFGGVNNLYAKEIFTNEVIIKGAPDGLTRATVERVVRRIQKKLEWSTRRTTVVWYSSKEKFLAAHGMGALARAVTLSQGRQSVIHLGPLVNEKNFEGIFGHELVHVIIYQKYRGAIPKWLEEGLANHLSKMTPVDYKWLLKRSFPKDITELAHPFQSTTNAQIIYRYKASQALAEMLDKKCDLENLIRLSVQRKMENYIETYCKISDLNKAFRSWVLQRAKLISMQK